jgi:hypothetical protein
MVGASQTRRRAALPTRTRIRWYAEPLSRARTDSITLVRLRIPTPQPCRPCLVVQPLPARCLRGGPASRDPLPTTINRCHLDRARLSFAILTWSSSWFDHLLSLPRTVSCPHGETMVSSRVCPFSARHWSSNVTSAVNSWLRSTGPSAPVGVARAGAAGHGGGVVGRLPRPPPDHSSSPPQPARARGRRGVAHGCKDR